MGCASPSASPAISVVVATRNRVALLARALRGIASQSIEDYEVIVLDDGSTSENRARLAELCAVLGDRFRVQWLGEPGGAGHGPSGSRNAAVSHCTAPLLAFCDDDDEWTRPDHLAVALRAFAENAELDYYFATQDAVLDGTVVKEEWLPALTAQVARQPMSVDGVRIIGISHLLSAGHFPHLNVTVVRRHLFDAVGGFADFLPYSEDLDISRRFAAVARTIGYRPVVVARHHVPPPDQGANASTRFDVVEKRLLLSLVHMHVAVRGGDDGIARGAVGDLGDQLRHLTELARQRHGARAARAFARMALVARPGWKWALYTLLLHLGVKPSR